MSEIKVDFSLNAGKIKPMHSVNNGPAGGRGNGNFDDFKKLEIPYVRNHDASFCSSYGGNHTVDVNFIFPDFEKDVNCPENYDFTLTDEYNKEIISAGSKVFYRLGSKIEHEIKKYGTVPPKDYLKWAKICEHIIMHYTEGWADGFKQDIEYWEIWNEPDCQNADGTNSCWQGTKEEFLEFFAVVFRYLKNRFPHLKIGGPPITYAWSDYWDGMLSFFAKEKIYPDFYSFHGYMNNPYGFADAVHLVDELIEKYNLPRNELILNEWNYNCGWDGEKFKKGVETIISPKGAAFTLATMIVCQNTSLDHLMYYDLRPCRYNGVFDFYTYRRLAGFYAFKIFGNLYKLQNGVKCETDDSELFCLAAQNGTKKALALTRFNDCEQPDKEVNITLICNGTVKVMLTNAEHTMETVATYHSNGEISFTLSVKNYDMYYMEIE